MIRVALKALLTVILVGWGGSALVFSVVIDSGAFGFLMMIAGALALPGGIKLLLSLLRQMG